MPHFKKTHMNRDLDINLSYPFEKAMTNDNPVKDAFLLIEELIGMNPSAQIKDKVAQSATLLICAHLLNLLNECYYCMLLLSFL